MRHIKLFVLITILFPATLFAVVNHFQYQGVLREFNQPVNGTRTMDFKIYNVPTGGSNVWDSGSVTVNVTSGTFSVILGPSLGWLNDTYYIETTCNSNVFTPRQQIQPAVFSLHSKTAEDINKLSGNICFSIAGSTYASVSNTGINVNGNITLSGTINGVNISTRAAHWDTAYNATATQGAVNGLLYSNGSGVFTAKNIGVDVPSLTGTGASGTWPIGISGRAAKATNVDGTVTSTSTANSYFVGGSVGVGTNSPEQTLDVNGILKMRRTANATSTNLYYNSNPLYIESTYWSGTGNTPLEWSLLSYANSVIAPRSRLSVLTPSSLEALSIRDDGNIGIGVPNPTSTLSVAGNVSISGAETVSKIIFSGDGSQLTTATGGSATAIFTNGNTSVTADANSSGVGTIQLITGVNLRMTVLNNGNIGVGTAGPGALFETYRTPDTTMHASGVRFLDSVSPHGLTITGSYYSGGTPGNQTLLTVRQAQTDNVNTNIYSPTAFRNYFVIDKNGFVTVTGSMSVSGTTTGNLTGNVSGSAGSCTGNAATVTNGVYTNANNAFAGTNYFPGSGVWNTSGNVGVGTTNLGSYRLNVNGDTNISGNMTVTGNISGSGSGLTGTASNLTAGAANSVAWGNISSKPTTVSGYSITDMGSQSVSYANTAGAANSVAWGNISSKPTTVSGYSITDMGSQSVNYANTAGSCSGNAATATTAGSCGGNAATVTNGVYTTGGQTISGSETFTGNISAANISASGKLQESGNALIPAGVIVMWSGSTASVPAGWHLCDGTNGTPDLRDKFIVGAGNSYSVAATGGTTTHTHTYSGTTDTYTPPFNASGGGSTASPAHAHTYHGTADSSNNLPPYFALCYIMKL